MKTAILASLALALLGALQQKAPDDVLFERDIVYGRGAGEGGNPEQPSQVNAVVAYFGPTDFVNLEFPDASRPIVEKWIGGTKKDKPEEYRKASPIVYVSKGDAPTLLIQGTKDPLVPHAQATVMVDAMTAAGVPGRCDLIVGAGHGWGGAELTRTVDATYAFFDQHLKARSKK